jgi:hypothetical protein
MKPRGGLENNLGKPWLQKGIDLKPNRRFGVAQKAGLKRFPVEKCCRCRYACANH